MNGAEKTEYITVCNANENNLKNITVNIPLEAFTCVIGPSGCGKSSLVYDTIYAESQRNFLESLSGNMYGQKLMDKPKVDVIHNLRPALNVSQNYYNVNPRATIGTVTDISYYLRTVFALVTAEKYKRNVDINYFSPNNPSSCCPKCKGLGEEYVISEDLLIPNTSKSLSNGGIVYYKGAKTSLEYKLLQAECEYFGIDIDKKISKLTETEMNNLLYRTDKIELTVSFKTPKGRYKRKTFSRKGVLAELNDLLKNIDTPSTFAHISKFLTKAKCSHCSGSKLKESILNIKVANKNIADVEAMTFDELLIWLNDCTELLKGYAVYEQITPLIFDIQRRCQFLADLKLEYLTLGRSIPSLSGGEIQRIRIAKQLSCSLCGLIYILDEPCKGLHYQNIASIIEATKALVNKGNTVITIEHNKQYISAAQKIIELGPSGGSDGGYIISESAGTSVFSYSINFKLPKPTAEFISIYDMNFHNLKNINVSIPCGRITCISGVSGSGKSSLVSV